MSHLRTGSTVAGSAIWHAGNFNPADYAPAAHTHTQFTQRAADEGVTGRWTFPSATVTGTLSAGTFSAGGTAPSGVKAYLSGQDDLLLLHAPTAGFPGAVAFRTGADVSNPPGARLMFVQDAGYSTMLRVQTKIPGALGNAMADRLTILGSGSVGVGTLTPGALLDVAGTLKAGGSTLGSTYVGGTLTVQNAAGGYQWLLEGSSGTGEFSLTANPSGTPSYATRLTFTDYGTLTTVRGNFTAEVSAPRMNAQVVGQLGPLGTNGVALGRAHPLYTALAASRPVFFDEEFAAGANTVGIYDNSNSNRWVQFRKAMADAPNRSGYVLEFTYDPARSGTSASPGLGGFYQLFVGRQNATFMQRFRAKLPVGYAFALNENSMGVGSTSYWLTPTTGTGKWEEYIRVVQCGTGTVSSSGHVSINGTSAPFTLLLASCNVYEVQESALLSLLDSAGTVLLGRLPVGASGVADATKLVRADDSRLKSWGNLSSNGNTLQRGGVDVIGSDGSAIYLNQSGAHAGGVKVVGTLGMSAAVRWDSTTNPGSDYGQISYQSDSNAYAIHGDSTENGALIIEAGNDVGAVNVADVIVLRSAATIVDGGSGSRLRVMNTDGYADIGAMNSGAFHFSTDRPFFYFNKDLSAVGSLGVYGSQTLFTASTGTIGGNRVLTVGTVTPEFLEGARTIRPASGDLNLLAATGVYDHPTPTNGIAPDWTYVLHMSHRDDPARWATQIAQHFHSDTLKVRRQYNGTWGGWNTIWTSATFDPGSKASLSGAAFTGAVSAPTLNATTAVTTPGLNVTSNSMALRSGASDHAYLSIYPRASDANYRGAFLGFPSAGSMDLLMSNDFTGMSVRLGGGFDVRAGGATVLGVTPSGLATLANRLTVTAGTGAADSGLYSRANVLLSTTDGSQPTLGFLRTGTDALALTYKGGGDLYIQYVTESKIWHSGNFNPANKVDSTDSRLKNWGLWSTNGGQDLLARGGRAMVAGDNGSGGPGVLYVNYDGDFMATQITGLTRIIKNVGATDGGSYARANLILESTAGSENPALTFHKPGHSAVAMIFRGNNELILRDAGTTESTIWHSTNFNPASKLNTAGGTITGTLVTAGLFIQEGYTSTTDEVHYRTGGKRLIKHITGDNRHVMTFELTAGASDWNWANEFSFAPGGGFRATTVGVRNSLIFEGGDNLSMFMDDNATIGLDGALNVYGELNVTDQAIFSSPVQVQANVYAADFIKNSSRALKQDVAPYRGGLDAVMALDVQRFRYRADPALEHVGIIADDVPDELVSGPGRDMFRTGNVVGILLRAVQELTARVRDLEGAA
ncbi:pyocin knob domain-containing S74 family peptidase [Deinococcus kurensis]|uniref:pyocin knob domain-containing S74 family peptidase n=1 Tax=Deinococcus kurensis TaxID=2662757 RepID=UPI0012D2C20A|nr:pyocin knob domain-containing S74 family peptidase [Deinococcus kurensis]